MRSWIIGAGMVVSYTINPDIVFSIPVAIWLIILLFVGAVADVLEFLYKA